MNILDPIFNPLLSLPKFWIVVIISAFISLIVSVIYKYMTDQKMMKQLKDDMKSCQNQMKEVKDNPQKMMEIQKKAMDYNMKYMAQSMKSTLITFIPVIIIFGWMNSAIAFEPIMPDTRFDISVTTDKLATGNITLIPPQGIEVVDGETKTIEKQQASWILKGKAGDYKEGKAIKITYDSKDYFKDVIISEKNEYASVLSPINDPKSNIKTIKLGNKEPILLSLWPNMNLLGYRGGWLGTYIIFSILFSMLFRKMMNLY